MDTNTMAAQVGDIIQAHCSQCKENRESELMAIVGDEVVTITCKTCGTQQRFRPPMDAKSRPTARRVVDVSGNDSPKPRGRSQRRVLSSTGREIIDDAPPRPVPPPPGPAPAPPPPVARPTGMVHMKNQDLVKRWDALTAGVTSRHGRPHRSHESYRDGEIILHTVHGMGIIEQVASDGTLTVLFKRGYQNLASRPHKVVEPAA